MSRKAIFDCVRRMLGRGFRRAEVRALDIVIDRFERAARGGGGVAAARGKPATVAPSPAALPAGDRRVSAEGVAMIRRFEGCARRRPDGLVEAYADPGSGGAPWSIGWGATGPDIGPDTVWTQARCDARLDADIARHAQEVDAALGDAPTTQAQFDALVSFHYNTGAIARATLTRKHRAGDFAGAAAEFGRWTRAAGRVLRGLERRRAAEARLYGAT